MRNNALFSRRISFISIEKEGFNALLFYFEEAPKSVFPNLILE